MEVQFFPGCFLLLLALCGCSFRSYLTRQKYLFLLCLLFSFHLKWQKRRKKEDTVVTINWILVSYNSDEFCITANLLYHLIFQFPIWNNSSFFSFSIYNPDDLSFANPGDKDVPKKGRKQIYITTHISSGQNQNSCKVFHFSARPTLWHLKTSSVSAFSHLSDLLQTCCTRINLVQ